MALLWGSIRRAALLGAALAAAASPAAAQTGAGGTVKSQHGAWNVVCDRPAGAPSDQCAVLQNVVAEDRPEVGLSVIALKTADGKARILRIIAPLGVLLIAPNPRTGELQGGLGLYVDGKSVGKANFVRCLNDGCYAEVPLDSVVRVAGKETPLVDALSNGKNATFIVFQTPEEGIGIPVDLNGFGEGFKALP